MRRIAKLLVNAINSILGLVNLKLVRASAPYTDYRDYIPFAPTLAAARESGLSVGDYVDSTSNVSGATQETIDKMTQLGVFEGRIDRVCEIGPGTGRYLERTLKACNPVYYEIYETAGEWKNYLVDRYKVTAHPADGVSLSSTPSESIDLVQAHKVISGQPSLIICCYFAEMARVIRQGGHVVFDMVTEECLQTDILEKWLGAGASYQHYPCLVPKQYTIDFFRERGLQFVGSFIVPMKPGVTECIVFKKQD